MKELLITGASGFVGRSVARALPEALTPSHSELDLMDYHQVQSYFKDHDISTVIHCAVAGPPYRGDAGVWGRKLNADITMASNLLRHNVRIILLTSGSIYGVACDNATEEDIDPLYARTDVSWAKFVISNMATAASTNTVELRPFGIYGPGELEQRFPSYCFKCIREERPIEIASEREISYIYVDDLVDIILYFIKNPGVFRIYNAVNPSSMTPHGIALACMDVANKVVPVRILGNGLPYTGSAYRLQHELLNWKPIKRKEGLQRLYDTLV